MQRTAVIGTRQPTEKQVQYVEDFIAGLDVKTEIISGCAGGIDTLGLKCAKKRGLHTVCYVPFEKKYSFADEVIVLSSLPDELQKEAFDSVNKYHPKKGGGRICSLFHARNYLIVYQADFVLALPNTEKKTGGTWQGIRVSIGLGIPLTVIDIYGKEIQNVISLR